VCCDENGLAVFALLPYRQRPAAIFLYAFDLLELAGQGSAARAAREPARRPLASLLRSCSPGLRLVEHIEHGGDVVSRHACKLGCEGIVSKRLGSPYVSGRTRHWLKFKNPAAPAVKREAEEDWGR
jgi:bifunctional non-homologous end joining protein LigD